VCGGVVQFIVYRVEDIQLWLQTWGKFNSGIDYLKNGIDELELKFPTKTKINPQIYLPFNFLIQKYFFDDNPTWNINYSVSISSRYSEYLLMVKSSR